jgi:predicted nucleic acid-binding protein
MAVAEPADGPVLLIDTNVVLDVVLERRPWVEDASALLDAIARHRAVGHIAGHAVTTVYYIVERERDRKVAGTAVSDLLDLLQVVPLSSDDFRRAIGLGLGDYEDAVQAAACLQVGADFLVTRNARDFKDAPVLPRSPGEILALLNHGPASSAGRG